MRFFTSLILSLAISVSAFAQGVSVSGKVTDANGAPLAGVTVTVQGNNALGASTDANGGYRITVPSQASVLDFSYIGYNEVSQAVGQRVVIDITLSESSEMIETVVAIGYGTRKATDLTGSVGSVTNDAIVARGASSVMAALQGAIPGVNISQSSTAAGGGFNIQIRGQQTMGDANAQQPLYVVDGIVVPDINFLNPGDIERIDVLKDASSAAIYGSRGSNGVVLVTTNQAASSRESFSISYDGYYGIRETVRLDDFMDGDDWWHFRQLAYTTRSVSNGVTSWTLDDAGLTAAMGTGSRMMVKRYAEKDYYDVLRGAFPNRATQNHFINMNGIQGNTSYTMSMGYTNEEGSLPGNDFERLNVRGGFQTKIKNTVTLGFQTNLSMVNNNRGTDRGVQRLLRLNAYSPPYDDEGNLIPYPMNNTSPNIANAEFPMVGTGTAFSSEYNPLLDALNTDYNQRSYNVMANMFAEVSPIKGLKLKTQFSPMLRTGRRGEFYDLLSGWSTDNALDGVKNAQTRAVVNRNMDFEYTWDNSAFYEWEQGDHAFDVTGVYSVYFSRSESTQVEGWNLSAPSFHGVETAKNQRPSSSSYGQTAMLSVIGRVNYSYKSKYLLTASYRTDGSSRLGDGNKWGGFPSAAIAWRISEEPFLKNWEPLYNAKIRASYGFTGNNRVGAYSTMTSLGDPRYYGFGDALYTGQPRGSVGNVALGWEKSRELNLGLDVAFFKGRLSATIDWYDRLSSDLLMGMKVPMELGMSGNSITSNVGSVRNRGIELGVTGVLVNNKDWYWNMGATFARNRNKIVELYGAKDDVVGERRFIGQPINVAYTYVFDGIVTAERAANDPLAKKHNLTEGMAIVKDLDKNGELNDKDRTITGTGFSDWTGSFTSSVSWKNLDFSLNLYADIGRYALNRLLRSDASALNDRGRLKLKSMLGMYNPGNVNVAPAPAWYTEMRNQFPNLPAHPAEMVDVRTDNATWPSYNNGGTYWPAGGGDDYQSSFQDLSFVKVKNITLGYTLPEQWTSAISLKQVRVYVNVLNPWVFTSKEFTGFDPEWASAELTGGMSGGRERAMNGPAIRTWQFGLNIKF